MFKKLSILFISLLATTLIATSANAQLAFKKYSFFKNQGGLNDSLSTLTIADGEATDIGNIVFDTAGAISKRYGYVNAPATDATGNVYQIGGGGNAVTGLAYYTNPTTGYNYIVAVVNVSGQATAYEKQLDASNNIPSGAWTNIGSTGLPTNYTNDEQPVLTNANGQLIFTFPAYQGWQPYAWSATGNVYRFSTDPNCPNATMSAYFNNILFLAGNPANPQYVYFNNLSGAFTSFVATDFFTLNFKDGHYVTALFPAFGNLYIFEDNSIWMLTGSSRDTFSLQEMVNNTGTVSPHSVQLVNNDIYFITKQNDVAIYDGVFTVKYLSSKIRNTIGVNNFNRAPQALGMAFSSYKYKDLDYYVSETTAGNSSNNQVLMFDTDREAWTKFLNFNPNAWTVIPSSTGQDKLIFGDYNGLVYSYPNIGTYNDVLDICSGGICTISSTSINAYYQTKWFTFSDLALGDKYLRVLKTYIQNSNISSTLSTQVNSDYHLNGINYTYNFNPSGALWGQAIWGVSLWGSIQTLNIDREEPNLGKQMFQLRYSNNNPSEDMTVLGFEEIVEPTTND